MCYTGGPDPSRERAVLRVGKRGHARSVYIGAWIFEGDDAVFYGITSISCLLLMYALDVTTGAIQSALLNRLLIVVCFPGMTSSLPKSKQTIGCALSNAFFLQFSYFLMFLNIHVQLIILRQMTSSIL